MITWNIVGYLKPSTERTYLLMNSPRTRMVTKMEAAPRFMAGAVTGHLVWLPVSRKSLAARPALLVTGHLDGCQSLVTRYKP